MKQKHMESPRRDVRMNYTKLVNSEFTTVYKYTRKTNKGPYLSIEDIVTSPFPVARISS